MVQYSFQKGRKPLADPGLKPRDSGPLSHYQNVLPPHNFVSADDNCASPFRGNIQYKDHIFNELHGKVQHKREKQLEKNPESESDLPNFDLRYASRARDIERDRNRELAAVRRGLKKVGSEGHHPTFVEIREDERPKKESVVDSLRKAKDAADEDGTGGRAMHQPTYFIDPNLQEVVDALEKLQKGQFSPQQPSPELDALIRSILADRPEWRQRMAVMTASATLRQKILNLLPPGGRAVGSGVIGATHPWRRYPKDPETGELVLPHPGARYPNYTGKSLTKYQASYSGEQNWPKVNPVRARLQRRVLPIKAPEHPELHSSIGFTIGKGDRFGPQPDATPGPGSYGQYSKPIGVPFNIGDYVMLGSNLSYPCEGMLSGEVTKIKHHTAPTYSFPRQRRGINDVAQGRVGAAQAAKSDAGGLSPGPVYRYYSATGIVRGEMDKVRSTRAGLLERIKAEDDAKRKFLEEVAEKSMEQKQETEKKTAGMVGMMFSAAGAAKK